MQLNWVHFWGAMPDDATESVATHSSRLQPSIICMPQLPPWCSATQQYCNLIQTNIFLRNAKYRLAHVTNVALLTHLRLLLKFIWPTSSETRWFGVELPRRALRSAATRALSNGRRQYRRTFETSVVYLEELSCPSRPAMNIQNSVKLFSTSHGKFI